MITTKAEMINQLPPEMIDTFTIYLIIGVVLIGLGIIGIIWRRMTSNNFWARHQEIKAKDAKAKFDKASKAAHKGHETRKEIAVARILTGTECDL